MSTLMDPASTILRNIYQAAAGEPHEPVSIASLDYAIGTSPDAVRPVLAHLEELGWVEVIEVLNVN